MRASAARILYFVAVLLTAAYAIYALRGPQGVPALIQKQSEIRELEKQIAALAREIELKRVRIQRLQQDLVIRERLKLVKPGEKVFILQDPVTQKDAKP